MPPAPFSLEHDALAHYARCDPDRIAIRFPAENRSLGFGQWHRDALAFARGLHSLGLRAGDHVALLAESRIEWPVVQIGVAMLGAVLVPLNTHYRRDELRYALTQSRSKALVLSPAFRSNHYVQMVEELRPELARAGDPVAQYIVFGDARAGYHSFADLLAAGAQGDDDDPLPTVDPDSIAMLLYTSGTTGFPKGALITHRAVTQNAWVAGNRLDLGERDVLTTMVPLFHCAGVIGAVVNSLVHGARYVGIAAFEAKGMLRNIEAERCTWLTAVPTAYLAMLQHPRRADFDLSSLRVGTCGGADCNPDVIERCAREFPIPGLVQVYGQTEATCFTSLSRPDDPLRYRSAGPPVEGLEARVTDPDTREVLPAGAVGQFELRGASVMNGYFELPRQTAEVIDADGWLQTGDCGYLTADGRIVLAGGRLKDMIIRGGENIYPVEVENVLASHPAVAEVAVFGLPDPYYGEVVAAAVRVRTAVNATALIEYGNARIARYKVPTRYFRAESFPLTANGKTRKAALRELALDAALAPLE